MPVTWQHPHFCTLMSLRKTRGGSHCSHVSCLLCTGLISAAEHSKQPSISKTSLTQSVRNNKFQDKRREVKDKRSTELFSVRDCKKHGWQNGACKVWACNHINNIVAVATIWAIMYQEVSELSSPSSMFPPFAYLAVAALGKKLCPCFIPMSRGGAHHDDNRGDYRTVHQYNQECIFAAWPTGLIDGPIFFLQSFHRPGYEISDFCQQDVLRLRLLPTRNFATSSDKYMVLTGVCATYGNFELDQYFKTCKYE